MEIISISLPTKLLPNEPGQFRYPRTLARNKNGSTVMKFHFYIVCFNNRIFQLLIVFVKKNYDTPDVTETIIKCDAVFLIRALWLYFAVVNVRFRVPCILCVLFFVR